MTPAIVVSNTAQTFNPSFVRAALTDAAALDWICPVNSPKIVIEQKANENLIDVIRNININGGSEIRQEHKWTLIQMPVVNAMIRLTYIMMVTLFVAPVGVLYNGVAALGSGCTYIFSAISGYEGTSAAKAKGYAEACFDDAIAFIFGECTSILLVLSTGMILVLPSIIVELTVVSAILTIAIIAFEASALHFLGAFSSTEVIANLAGKNQEERARLYFTMELRKDLGYINSEKGLLSGESLNFFLEEDFTVMYNRKVTVMKDSSERNLSECTWLKIFNISKNSEGEVRDRCDYYIDLSKRTVQVYESLPVKALVVACVVAGCFVP